MPKNLNKSFKDTQIHVSNEFNSRDIIIVLLIFVLALSLRIIYFTFIKNTSIFPVLHDSDGYFYTLWARDIASGDILGAHVFMKWPLYAYFLGSLFAIIGANFISAISLQFILGSLNCVLVYLIAKKIFNWKVGLISASFCIFYGLFIFYDSLFIYTSLSLFLNSLFFLAVLYAKEKVGRKNLFWLGAFLGTCTLTQGNILIFGLLAIIWVLISKKIVFWKFIQNFLYFLFGLSLVLGAVTLRNYLVGKDFVPVQASFGINFYLGNNPQATGTFFCPSNITMNQENMFRDSKIIARMERNGKDLKTSEVSSFWFRKSFGFINHNPAAFLKLFLKKLSYLFSPQEFIYDNEYNFIRDKIGFFNSLFMTLKFIFPFWILGMFFCLRKIKDTAPLYIIIFTIPLSIALFFVTSRYRMVMMPFAMIFSGFAIYEISKNLKQKRFLKFILFVLAAFLMFLWPAHKESSAGRLEYLRGDSAIFDDHMYKAFDYEESGDYLSALKESELANKVEPRNRRALFRLGVLNYRLNNFKSAEDNFKVVIKIDGLSVDAYYNLGLIYNQQMRFNEAKVMLEKAVFFDPDDPKSHFELAMSYKSTGELLKAKNEFNLSLKNLSRWRYEDRKIIEAELKALAPLK